MGDLLKSSTGGLPGRFAERLRKDTSSVHTRAEKTAFISGFLRGTATLPAYTRLLVALHPVYRAMEEEMVRLATVDPVLARFHFPVLRRTQALERDLCFLAGTDWANQWSQRAASRAYEARIRQVAANEPVRLIGHLYTRYMGDLSGGQILARIAERSLGLAQGAGLDFYEFSDVEDVAQMKALFRSRLDELDEVQGDVTAPVVDESIRAFKHNIALFNEIEGRAWVSFWRNLPLPWVRAHRLTPMSRPTYNHLLSAQ